MSDKVIETDAETIEAPAVQTKADMWLAEQRERVAARRGDFHAFEIESPEQYRDAKAQRKALRALIAEVDGDKRRMTKQLRETLDRFNSEVGDILLDLRAEDDAYKGQLDAWEQEVVRERDARIARRYLDEYPDLAAQVPYERLRERYGGEWKAQNFGTKEAAIWKGVEAAAEDVARSIETLGAQTHVDGIELTEDDRRDLMAEFFRTLDQGAAMGACIDRVRQREALRRAEEERRAWEAEKAAQTAPHDVPDAQSAPEPAPAQQKRGRRQVKTYVYEVKVPSAQLPAFIAAMKALPGTHGACVRKEYEE